MCLFQMRSLLRSTTVKTIFYGVLSLGWANAASLLAVPIYVRVLGHGEWGLAAACTLLQTLASFLDAGLSQIVPREISVANHDRVCVSHVATHLRKRYLVAASFLLLSVEFGAGFLAESWFKATQEEQYRLVIALRISAIQVFFQFLNSLNLGIWYGLERHRTANLRSCTSVLARHGLALICISFVDSSVITYCTCFAVVAAAELLVNTISIQKLLRHNSQQCRCDGTLRSVGPQSSNLGTGLLLLTAGTIIGIAVAQGDRIATSRFATLTDYGIYSAISAVAASLLALQAPVSRVFLPQLVGDFRIQGWPTRSVMLKLGLSMVSISVAPTIVAALFADPIVRLFVADSGSIKLGVQTLRLQLCGVALSAPLACLYLVMLASGRYGPMLALNTATLVLLIALVTAFPDRADIRMGGILCIAASSIRAIGATLWYSSQSRRISTIRE